MFIAANPRLKTCLIVLFEAAVIENKDDQITGFCGLYNWQYVCLDL